MAIPPYYPDGGPGGVLFSSQSCSADFTTSAVSVQGYNSLSFEFDWTGMSATGGASFSIESSNSGSGWNLKTDPGGASAYFAITAASGVQLVNLNMVASEAYYRISFAHSSNSTGTASCYMVGK